jgi:hypothetical protein
MSSKCCFTKYEKIIIIQLTVQWVLEQKVLPNNVNGYLIGVLSGKSVKRPKNVEALTRRLATLRFVQEKGGIFNNGTVQKLLDRIIGRTQSDRQSATHDECYPAFVHVVDYCIKHNKAPHIDDAMFTSVVKEPAHIPFKAPELTKQELSKKDQYIITQAIEDYEFLLDFSKNAPASVLEVMAAAFAEYSM